MASSGASNEIKARAWQGHLAMLAANMVWGAMSPICKGVLESGAISGTALSAVRILGGTLLFLVTGLFLPRSIKGEERVARGDLAKMFVASILMISANQALYIIGIGYTTPIDSAVMSTLTPVFTMLLAAIFIAMPLSWMKTGGVALGLGGALIMVLIGGGRGAVATNPALGDTLCLLAQMCAALYYVLFAGFSRRYTPFTMMKWMFIFSSLSYVPCTLPWLLATDWGAISLTSWLSIAYIVVFATFIGYLLIPFSQRLLKPTVVSMYTYFQPTTAALLAAVMGFAQFGVVKIVATLMIFAGVWFVTRSPSGKETPEATPKNQ